jgi:hypothetical protein
MAPAALREPPWAAPGQVPVERIAKACAPGGLVPAQYIN